jgi:hypothetical protein
MGFTPVSPSQQRPLVAFTTLVTRLIDATTASSESGFTRAQFVGGFFREVRVCLCRQNYLLDRAVAGFITRAASTLTKGLHHSSAEMSDEEEQPAYWVSRLGCSWLMCPRGVAEFELLSDLVTVGWWGVWFSHGAFVFCCFLS